ncbi:MAG: hypothetical protein PHF25_01555 [Candidatus Margulisbacteria bacterium]|nr:hypothetical protein [Candidatus Margulisiibacteriota bacterium]
MSLSVSILMLVAYTVIGYVASFKLSFKYFKKLQFFIFNLVMSPYIFLNIFNYLTIDFFFANYWIIIAQSWFIFLAIITFRYVKSKRGNVDFNMLAFQNAGFLTLPIIAAMPNSEHLKVLLFMYMIGFNLSVFSIGAMVLSEKRNYRGMFNLPFFASVLPIILVFIGFGGVKMPALLLLEDFLGLLLIPGALFFFGGVIRHSMIGKKSVFSGDMLRIILIKYLFFPATTLLLIYFFKFDKLVAILLIIQSLMPPAVNLILLPSSDEDKDQMSAQMGFLYIVFMIGALAFAVCQL